MGGLPRRNKVLMDAAAKGPTLSLDAGLSLVKPGLMGPQRQAKAALVAESLAVAGTDALTFGTSDWAVGAAHVRKLVADHELPLLAANLVCDGKRPYPGTKVVERGGKKVGIVGLTDGAVQGCTVEPMRAALDDALASLPAVDLTIVLLPTDNATTRDVLLDGVATDLVFDAHRTRMSELPERVGDSYLLGSGPKGQRVGVTRLSWRAGADAWVPVGGGSEMQRKIERLETRIASFEQRLAADESNRKEHFDRAIRQAKQDLADLRADKAELDAAASSQNTFSVSLVELDDEIGDHEATARLVEAFKATMDAGAPTAAAPKGPRTAPGSSPYAGAAVCAGCHPAIHGQWAATPHAQAWKSLVDDGHAADEDCFACHATGVGQPGGPTKPADVLGLRDVQCESCHGPARKHTQDPTNTALHPVRAPAEAVCTSCHDGERDMGRFDLQSYLPKVTHKTPRVAE
jgi:hypothetical protein